MRMQDALDILAGAAGTLALIWLAVCLFSADARGATRESPCERLAAEHELAAGGLATCHQVVSEARRQGVNPALAVALAYRESRCSAGARNSSGRHLGPLQVAVRIWCPGGRTRGCNLVAAGVRALRHYLGRGPTVEQGICAYLGARRCTGKARGFARAVVRLAEEMRWARS